MSFLRTLLILVFVYFISSSNNVFAKCGNIKIPEMPWASAEFFANLDKFFLETKFGCEVELVAGNTLSSFDSINLKGTIDIIPEFWANSVEASLKRAINRKKLYIANFKPIPGLGEGWWVSPSVIKNHPELKTVLDIIERPDLFPHPEDSSKGGIMTCPAGWNCQLSTNNLFRAFKMEEKGWKLIDPGSAAGLDGAIAKASTRNKNWFGYYWAPTSVVGKYGLVKIPFGVDYDDDNWHNCIVKPENQCLYPKKSSWMNANVRTITNNKIYSNKDIYNYLTNRSIPVEVMNKILVFMSEDRASGYEATEYFISNYPNIWKPWLKNKNINTDNKMLKAESKTIDKSPKPSVSSAELNKEKQKRIALQRKTKEDELKRKALEKRIAELEKKNKELQTSKNRSIQSFSSDVGSGFYVSNLRHVVTNQHVVNKCKKITVGYNNSSQIKADLVASDKRNDLAILQTSSMEMASAEEKSFLQKLRMVMPNIVSKGLMRLEDVSGGEEIFVAGFPLGTSISDEMKLDDGIVRATKGMDNDVTQFIISSDIQKGNSGGPIYDKTGNIVGMAVSRFVNKNDKVNFAIKGSTIKQFLSANDIPTKWANKKEEMDTKDIYQLASKQTVMVVCHN